MFSNAIINFEVHRKKVLAITDKLYNVKLSYNIKNKRDRNESINKKFVK